MNNREVAKSMDGKLYRIFRCFGRKFPVYYEYSDEDWNAVPDYPDFKKYPQYTDKGQPFALATQDGCEHAASDLPGEPFSGECGSCKYFLREPETSFSIFGICTCDKRQEPQEETEELK